MSHSSDLVQRARGLFLAALAAALWTAPVAAQVATTRPVATTCPAVVTQCPTSLTKCPTVETKCPPEQTKCPVVDTTCPAVATKCPATLTNCPVVDTRCPPSATKCPVEDTKCPPTQTKCPVVDTTCPPSLTKCPATLTNCPVVDTRCPPSATKCPVEDTKCPPTQTKCPVVDTTCPPSLTKCPATLTNCPVVDTRCPPSATKCPVEDTKCPPTQTKCPVVDTTCPPSLTKCPATLTNCPAVDTRCPPSATKCPAEDTKCPPTQTKCPVVPTTCPPTPLGARNDLFGWVSNSPAGEIDVQTTHDYGCTAVKKCPGVLVPATNAIAGGSAYDPRFQAAWSSDGINLSLDGLRNCDLICRGVAVRILGATSVVSGLAVHDSAQRLYQLETVPGAFGVVTYDIKDPKTTCFQAIDRCTGKTVTANGVAGGLAYDEGRGLLFLSTSEPGAATWSHFIHVFRAAAPCQPVCRWQITGNCMTTLGPVTGLAYDNCASILYATDGIQVLEIAVGDPTQCQFRSARCCSAVARYRGLALTSGWTLEHIGRNCLLKPCASCPNMYLRTTGGDPSLGNTSFGLQLVNAPGGPGQFAGLYLRVGGCTAGFPLFCSSFHAYPGVGPFITPLVGASCSGTATWPLPIPPVAAYCGIKLCAQALVICQSSPGTGVGVSNALQFPITN